MPTPDPISFASIPMQRIGPVALRGPAVTDAVMVPLATFETPLWPSTQRGARVTEQAGGIGVVVADERMARSVLLRAPDAASACAVVAALPERRSELESVVAGTSRYCRLRDWHWQVVGNLLYLRLECETGDAAGHNMVTQAADAAMQWLLATFPSLQYLSVSGNYCCDKKVSAVNGILGRGRYTVADVLLSARLVQRYLKTTPAKVVDLHVQKNLLGSLLAGSVRSANAHFANMLLAFYLATGQDAANIIEGSQGFTHAEARDGDLYFSVTLPNLILGTVGNGKDLPFAQDNLAELGCLAPRPPGENARRLAAIAAATVLCGELSLLAAQTNPGELMAAHRRLER